MIFPGIYVDHTGPLTWEQRAWDIHIAVASDRRVTARPGVHVHRRPRLDDEVAWHLQPPRVRVHEAVPDIADDARTETDAVAALTDAVSSRITTASHLLDAMDRRPRMRRRTFLRGVLADISNGTCSVLEHKYLTDVERPHGLPDTRPAGADACRACGLS
ncbi:hypothetical protein [Gordonia sp. (in: high G+C Gram-positive bacteria)]|uniref:hypothetical protein n=1 Tax=Gordonia sp. (in: high G+C Gram-positive bacteria) TaxID=84139 RepID=UPI003C7740B7